MVPSASFGVDGSRYGGVERVRTLYNGLHRLSILVCLFNSVFLFLLCVQLCYADLIAHRDLYDRTHNCALIRDISERMEKDPRKTSSVCLHLLLHIFAFQSMSFVVRTKPSRVRVFISAALASNNAPRSSMGPPQAPESR